MSAIQIYTWSNCPYCIRAKELLKRKGIKFDEIDLDGKDDEVQALRTRTGFRTLPQIFIEERMIGGFTELAALDADGKLEYLVGR